MTTKATLMFSEDKIVPQMGDNKVRFIEKFLLTREPSGERLRVLEWGAGTSTAYFSNWLQKNGINYEWTAIEYDDSWYKEVAAALQSDPNTSVIHISANGNPRSRETKMDDYVSYPKTTGKKYDLVIVDGRKRRRCVLMAKEILADDGVVLLHDAWRPWYFCALEEYPNNQFIDRSLWKGELNNVSLVNKIRNFILNTLYKTRGRFRVFRKRLKLKLNKFLR